jgi:hypothetical protein
MAMTLPSSMTGIFITMCNTSWITVFNWSRRMSTLMRALQCFAFVFFALLPGVARADFFIFNATTNPMTGVYIPRNRTL